MHCYDNAYQGNQPNEWWHYNEIGHLIQHYNELFRQQLVHTQTTIDAISSRVFIQIHRMMRIYQSRIVENMHSTIWMASHQREYTPSRMIRLQIREKCEGQFSNFVCEKTLECSKFG